MLLGAQGIPPGMCGCVGCSSVQGGWLGGSSCPSPLCFGDTGRDGGTGPPPFQLSPRAGKDGMAVTPLQTLVLCGVQVGDKAVIRAPSPCCAAPQAVPGRGPLRLRVWLVRFQTLRVLRGGRRGARLGSPSGRWMVWLAGAFCASPFPVWEVCPQGRVDCAVGVLVARCRAVVQGAFRGRGFIHRLWSSDFSVDVARLAGTPAAAGGHLGAASVWGCLGLMVNVEDRLTGCRCLCPGWSLCPGMRVRLWQEHGDPPEEGILATGAHGACVQTQDILPPSPSASVTSLEAIPCIPPTSPCPSDSSWQRLRGEAGASGARIWAAFRGTFGRRGGWWTGALAGRQRGARFLVAFVPSAKETVLYPQAKGLLPPGA